MKLNRLCFSIILCLCLLSVTVFAHADTLHENWFFPAKMKDGVYSYHYRPERTVDFIHLALEIKVLMQEQRLEGTARYTFRPVHDGVTHVELDANKMDIGEVRVQPEREFTSTYSENKLYIHFEAPLPLDEDTIISIPYSAEPEESLYFTDSQHVVPESPDQLYTLGEPSGGSDWFPAPDYPNDRMQTEILVTVPKDFVTLSNGVLTESTIEGEWKTDHWKQEMPHVIYLVSLVVGKFDIVEDIWNGIPVQYYVEEGLAEDARPSMGKTPEMLTFFSDYFDYPYPYEKYAQVAVRDFRAGGMEHTTATTLYEFAVIDEQARLDNDVDWLVAHELAHQWFGDLVTCESWAHLWLNESFASYSEILWAEHDRGEDEALHHLMQDLESYVGESRSYKRAIVTNQFENPQEMFDGHSYPKGSVVLHMLRNRLGDGLFRKSIAHYLDKYSPGLVDTDDLMEAIEEATGRPMEQFFHQWVFSPGHPILKVTHEWLPEEKQLKMTFTQTQEMEEGRPAFAFPLQVEISTEDECKIHSLQISKKEETAVFDCSKAPLSINVDPKLLVLMEVQHEKPRDMLLHDLKKGSTVLVRMRAAQALHTHSGSRVIAALKSSVQNDPYWGVQAESAQTLGKIKTDTALNTLVDLATHDHPKVRRAVVQALGNFYKNENAYKVAVDHLQNDESIRVVESAARTLGQIGLADAEEALHSVLQRESYQELIRRAALDAMVDLELEQAYDSLVKFSQDPYRTTLRNTAIQGLGKLGAKTKDHEEDILDLLISYLGSKSDRLRNAAISSLKELNHTDAISHLQKVAENDSVYRVRRNAAEAIKAIRENQGKNLASESQEKIEELEKQQEKLLKQVEELQEQLKELKEVER